MEQTSRIAHKVKWITVCETHTKAGPGTVNLGPMLFDAGQPLALGEHVPRCHAEIWYAVDTYIDFVNAQSSDYGFRSDQPVAIKYPHDSFLGDGVESPYLNPYNSVCYLVRTAKRDAFNLGTIFHEIEHLHTFQNTTGETAMFGQLIRNGTTHGGPLKPYVVWYEAFAEVVSNEVYRRLFGQRAQIYTRTVDGTRTGAPLLAERRPFTRRHLRNHGMKTLDDVDQFEDGWMSALALLLCPDVLDLDMDPKWGGVYAHDNSPGQRRVPHGTTLGELFEVVGHPGRKSDDGMNRRDITLRYFYEAVADRVERFTEEMVDQYLAILDPAETRTPAEILYQPPVSLQLRELLPDGIPYQIASVSWPPQP